MTDHSWSALCWYDVEMKDFVFVWHFRSVHATSTIHSDWAVISLIVKETIIVRQVAHSAYLTVMTRSALFSG